VSGIRRAARAGRTGSRCRVTWLPPDLDETAVVEAAARRGPGVYGVGPYRVSSVGPSGLTFGYATLGEAAIGEGIELLAAVIDEVRSR
jgi:GntR family transcriptional regulator/MocR family aminotransferase